jgi:GNAT superfamily N-acetyltransferase
VTRALVRVRPASFDDIPQLVELISGVDTNTGVFSGKPLTDPSPEHVALRLKEILTEDERVLLVAIDDPGAVVGLLAARRDAVGAIDLTPVLHVTHLIVLPASRRHGVGRQLLAAAVQLADESGIEHLLATAAAGSREGNRYLARLGFAPLVVHRIAPTSLLRRTLGLTEIAGRMAVLRRARLIRSQRSGLLPRAVSGNGSASAS